RPVCGRLRNGRPGRRGRPRTGVLPRGPRTFRDLRLTGREPHREQRPPDLMKTYPAITFIAIHGRRLALALASACALGSVVMYVLNKSAIQGVVGLFVAGILWAVVRIASEIIEVVADTLVPR